MISLIVLLIFALSALAAGGFYFYTLLYNQNLQLDAQKNEIFLQKLENNLISYARPVGNNGEYALPFGDNSASNYHTVPKWLSAQRKNPWGKYVAYCPFGYQSSGSTNDSVQLSASNNYSVELLNDFRTKVNDTKRDYVISSQYLDINGDSNLEHAPDFNNDNEADDILGFLISYFPNSNDSRADCQDITYLSSEEVFNVSGGTVRAIYEQDAMVFNTLKEISQKPQKTEYTYNIDGNENNTLNSNLEFYSNFYDNEKIYFYLEDGTFEMDDFSFSNEDKTKKEIEIIGVEDDGSTTETEESVITSSGTSSTLEFEGYNVTLNNVTLDDTTRLKVSEGSLHTENRVDLSTLFINNTEWFIKGNTTVLSSSLDNTSDVLNGTSSSAFLKSSELFIDGSNQLTVNTDSSDSWGLYGFDSTFTLEGDESTDNLIIDHNSNSDQYGVVLYQSEFNMRDATTRLNASNSQSMGLYIDSNSEYHAFDSTLSLSGEENSGVYLRGFFEGLNHNVITRNFVSGSVAPVIEMKDNAELILRGATTVGNTNSGDRPAIGIFDDGAKFVGGQGNSDGNVNIYAQNKCWQGPTTTEPRIFQGTFPTTGTQADIGENGSTSNVQNTDDPNHSVYQLSNNSLWNCIQ